MVAYLAMRMEMGKMNYNAVFAINRYKVFKDDIDAILAADGYTVNADGTVVRESKNDI